MTDALLEAEALLDDLPGAVSRRSLGEQLGKAIQELRTAGHQIQRMEALIDTAEITGFGAQPAQATAMEEMVDTALMVGEALEDAEDPASLRKAVYEYTSDLNKAIARLEHAVRDHWRVVANERFQPMIGLGELLTSMGMPNDLGGRLVACGRQAVTMPAASSAVDLHTAVTALLAAYDTIQAERAVEIGEGEVGDFINALADKRATLAMVTQKVRDWLVDHDALDRLGITTR